jgi:hypothetical protein
VSGTGTATIESTFTFVEQVLRVTRPVYSDLLALIDMYGQLTKEDAWKYVQDFRTLMNEQYLKEIEIRWLRPGTLKVIDGIKYVVVNGEAVRAMDRPGGIAYDQTLKNASFSLVIRHTQLWHSRSAQFQADFEKKLKVQWSDAAPVDYGSGSYVDDGHQYGAASVGVSRKRFKTS